MTGPSSLLPSRCDLPSQVPAVLRACRDRRVTAGSHIAARKTRRNDEIIKINFVNFVSFVVRTILSRKYDIKGDDRIINETVDMGAYEYKP